MPATYTDRLDGLTTSVAVKAPCRVATTGAIQLSGLQTIDGVALATGDRVLVKDQANKADNGIWMAFSGAWTRALDFDGSRDVVGGTQVSVLEGSANNDTYWRPNGAGIKTIGTDALTFEAALLSSSATQSFTAAGTGATPRTVQDKLRERVTPADFGAKGDGATDDTAALNAWALAIKDDDGILAGECSGSYLVTGKITIDLNNTGKQIKFGATIQSNYAGDEEIVRFVHCRNSSFPGSLTVLGKGTGTSRTNRDAIVIDGCLAAKFGKLTARNVYHTGVQIVNVTDFSSFVNVDALTTTGCGQAIGDVNGFASTWSSPVNSGDAGQSNQRTVITVAALPGGVRYGDMVVINGEPYTIQAVDAGASKITLFPWVDSALSSGAIQFFAGAGLEVVGTDVSCVTIGQHVSSNCAIGRKEYALYPGRTAYFSAESNGVGLALSRSPTGIGVGGGIGTLYCEGNTLDLAKNTVTEGSRYEIGTWVLTDYTKIVALAPRESDNSHNVSASRMPGIILPAPTGGKLAVGTNNVAAGLSFATLTLDPNDTPVHTFRANSMTITLSPNESLTRLYGRSTLLVMASGSGTNGAATGTYTFNPTSGYTVNGGSSVALGNFKHPTLISCRLNGTDWEVNAIGGSASATYTATGVTTSRSFNAGSVSTSDLANVVGTLIADLRAAGIVL